MCRALSEKIGYPLLEMCDVNSDLLVADCFG